MLIDVNRVEENPERMRGIGQAAMGEGVTGKQVAELVVNQARESEAATAGSAGRKIAAAISANNRQILFLRQADAPSLDGAEKSVAQQRKLPGYDQQN